RDEDFGGHRPLDGNRCEVRTLPQIYPNKFQEKFARASADFTQTDAEERTIAMLDRDNDNAIIQLTSKIVSSLEGLLMNLHRLNLSIEKLDSVLTNTLKETDRHNKVTRGLTWALVIVLPLFG
ncbi:MAG: hypothetical protein AAB699_01325, partial [Patescibacteria group bacterium]